jgi:hypothetical protein
MWSGAKNSFYNLKVVKILDKTTFMLYILGMQQNMRNLQNKILEIKREVDKILEKEAEFI